MLLLLPTVDGESVPSTISVPPLYVWPFSEKTSPPGPSLNTRRLPARRVLLSVFVVPAGITNRSSPPLEDVTTPDAAVAPSSPATFSTCPFRSIVTPLATVTTSALQSVSRVRVRFSATVRAAAADKTIPPAIPIAARHLT